MRKINVINGVLSEEDIDYVVNVLKNDGLIVYPTDTVYGVGCSATSAKAVQKVMMLKERSSGSVFSVMVDSIGSIKKYAHVGMLEEHFLEKYLPGPVTVVLKLKEDDVMSSRLVKEVKNKDGATGFRVIDSYEFIPKLCSRLGCPIISTSANKSKQGQYEYDIDFVISQFEKNLDMIDVIIDAGVLKSSIPSTVVDLTKIPHTILRRGAETILQNDLR